MERKIKTQVNGYRTVDGAGVSLVRVLGNGTIKEFDPILMLDSFDSVNPDDYTAGFPMHPHRGIETVSYLYRGKMKHKDTLGNEDTITDGEVQWMNSGSGILHEEQVPAAERLLGVQLWLNLPQKEKMSKPTYRAIRKNDIEEIPFDGGYLRLLSGEYKDHKGHSGEHLPLNYYDVHLEPNEELVIDTLPEDSVMAFTLLEDAIMGGEKVREKTAVKLTDGDTLILKGSEKGSQILVMISKKLDELVAWAGPIVMNTREELNQAFYELRTGEFIKDKLDFKTEH
ncbi:MAG: pirin family protein [Eubacteriales bacterium]|nr:pirin family protein [Clostridiales bacterium]MDY5836512.1 pirin family protein [Eubacteriales bacterium]